jgi:hypothetical protein
LRIVTGARALGTRGVKLEKDSPAVCQRRFLKNQTEKTMPQETENLQVTKETFPYWDFGELSEYRGPHAFDFDVAEVARAERERDRTVEKLVSEMERSGKHQKYWP